MERELRLYKEDAAYVIADGTLSTVRSLVHLKPLYEVFLDSSPVGSDKICGMIRIVGGGQYRFNVPYSGENVSPEDVDHVLHRKARDLLFNVAVGENISAKDMVAEDRRRSRAVRKAGSSGEVSSF